LDYLYFKLGAAIEEPNKGITKWPDSTEGSLLIASYYSPTVGHL